MEEFEKEIFEVLQEGYTNNDRDDVVFQIIRERVRIANELWQLGSIDVDKISKITGLTVKDVMEANGNN